MADTKPIDVGEEVQVSTRKTKVALKRETEIAQLKMLLDSVHGRAVIWRILSQCGVYRTSFTGDSETFFKEGKRAVGLWLLDELFEADPAAFSLMQKEATDRGDRK